MYLLIMTKQINCLYLENSPESNSLQFINFFSKAVFISNVLNSTQKKTFRAT